MVYACLVCDNSKFELRFPLSCVMMCEQLKLQLSGLEIYYADWNRLINCDMKQCC